MSNKNLIPSLDPNAVNIAPSILAADFSKLGEEISRAEEGGAEVVHVDVMDGVFVPNISMGPPVVKAIRKTTELPFDVHLMIQQPQDYIQPFAKAGADHITIHVESDTDVAHTLKRIDELGCSRGLTLKPGTHWEAIRPFINEVEMILVMTVEPGFGGQSFMKNQLEKIREIRKMISESGRVIQLEVDGGINEETAPSAIQAGANVLVAGTGVFRDPRGCRIAIDILKGKQE